MSVQLFKAGTGTVVNGIECESGVFNEYSFLHLLDEGWCYTAEECYQEPIELDKQTIVEGPDAEDELSEETTTDEEASNGQNTESEAPDKTEEEKIRLLAKEKGISHYWTKSIDRLKEEIADVGQSEE